MISPLTAAQLAVSTVILVHGAWWTGLSLLALRAPAKRGPLPESTLTTTVIVPAHNEERLIESTLQSLFNARRSESPELLVVADNCTDATASIARSLGANVFERQDTERRGKPFALNFALNILAQRPVVPDVVMVVDADTAVSDSFFEAVEARISRGARAVQVHYAAGPAETDLGRLRRLAFSLIHWSRPLGAARLRLGTSLKGNGMAFSWEVASLGLSGTGVTEDAESTLALARHGIIVEFEPLASVQGYMAQSYEEARTQDARWEGGRSRLTASALRDALFIALRGRLRPIAGALEVASLPLSLLGIMAIGSLAAAVAGFGSLLLAETAMASIAAYVIIGLIAAGSSLTDLRALRTAPRFVLHKLRIYSDMLSRRSTGSWQRTNRG